MKKLLGVAANRGNFGVSRRSWLICADARVCSGIIPGKMGANSHRPQLRSSRNNGRLWWYPERRHSHAWCTDTAMAYVPITRLRGSLATASIPGAFPHHLYSAWLGSVNRPSR